MTGHVLHLATTHTPRDPRVVLKEAQTMADAGLDVAVVTPADADGQTGTVPTYAVARPTGGLARMTTTARDVVRRAVSLARPGTVFHLHDADLLLLGLALAARGRRVVYDAHEDTPRQMLHQPWIPRPLRRPVSLGYSGLEAAAGRLFDGVITTVPTVQARYPAAKAVMVRNFPIVGELAPPASAPYAERGPDVVYVGAITPARGLAEMLAAQARLPASLGATLHLAGPFHPPELAGRARAADGVVVHGRLDRPEVAALLARSRVGVSVLHPTASYLDAYPTKLFEYMAAGLPVVVSDSPMIRDFVEPAGCGLLVDPLDPAAIADAVGWLLSHPDQAGAMGERGRAAVLDGYTWAREGRRLLAFYAALLAGDRRPGEAARRAVPC